jgi:hypothetical protein
MSLSGEQADELRQKNGASRLMSFLRTVAQSGVLYAWGDDDGVEYMEDASGMAVVPLWSHPLLAEREFRGDPDDANGPVAVPLDRFIDVWLPSLDQAGEGIAIFPSKGRIAVTLTPAEFRSKIAAECRRLGVANPLASWDETDEPA